MGWENIPLNTCPVDDPVLPAVELVDQDGRVLNVIVASMCDAWWLAHAYAELGMYEGATAITCRSRTDAPTEEGESFSPPTVYPPIGDAPLTPLAEQEPINDLGGSALDVDHGNPLISESHPVSPEPVDLPPAEEIG